MGPWTGVPRGHEAGVLLAALIVGLTPGVALASQSDDPYASRALTSRAPRRTAPTPTSRPASSWSGRTRTRCGDVYDIDHGVAKLVSIGPDGGNRDGPCVAIPSGPKTHRSFEDCDASFRGPPAAGSTSGPNRCDRPRARTASTGTTGTATPSRPPMARSPRPRTTPGRSSRTGTAPASSSGIGRVDPDLDWPGRLGGGCPGYGDFHFVSQTDDGDHGVLLCPPTTRGRRHRRGSGICT